MERPKLPARSLSYTPTWPGVFEAWSRKWVARHYWRVRNVLPTPEDALQECALIWAKCADHYKGVCSNPAWFMALYTRTVSRRWHTLAEKDTACPLRYSASLPLDFEGEAEALFNSAAELPCGLLAAQVNNASPELVQLFSLLANAPAELLSLVFAEGTDANINQRLRRILKFTSKADVIGELRELLRS